MENDEGAKKCEGCGHKLARGIARKEKSGGQFGDYFAFRKLVTPDLIRAFYFMGALFITLGSVVGMLYPQLVIKTGWESLQIILMSVVVFIIGNLFWRMICEAAILMFSIHETLVSIDERARLLEGGGNNV